MLKINLTWANNFQVSVKRRLLRLAYKYLPFLSITVLSRIINLLLWCALLALPAWTIGALVSQQIDSQVVWVWIVPLMVAMGLGKGIIRYTEQLSGHFVAFHVIADLRILLFDGAYPQAPAVTEKEGSGRLIALATGDVDRLEVFYAHTIAPAIAALVVPSTVVVFIASVLGWPAALVAGIGIFLGGVFSPLLGAKASGRYAQKAGFLRKELSQSITETINGTVDIAQFEAQTVRKDLVIDITKQISSQRRGAGKLQGIRQAVLHAWPLSTALLIFLTVVWQAQSLQAATLPWLLASMASILGITNALFGITTLARSLPSALAAAKRIFILVDTPPVVSEPVEPTELFVGPYSLEIKNVDFAYETDRLILHQVNLKVEPGQLVAVVGATGSGKSTLGAIAARVRDPQSGDIVLGGAQGQQVKLTQLSLKDTRSVIGMSTQRNMLLMGTIASNLRLGCPDATPEQMKSVLAQVGFSLDSFPLGLDTPIDQNANLTTAGVKGKSEHQQIQEPQNGRQISGGEAQRLCLARTLLSSPKVLILDEATSHQDSLTQAHIVSSIKQIKVATLVIAHRITTVRHADVIHVIDEGRIVESGTWETLIARNGAFAHLLAASDDADELEIG